MSTFIICSWPHGAVFWATVGKTVRPRLSDHCLSCMSATLVRCGETVGWIKMKLGMQVGLSPRHVLDGDRAPLPKDWGTAHQFLDISVVAKWLHRSRCHLVWR